MYDKEAMEYRGLYKKEGRKCCSNCTKWKEISSVYGKCPEPIKLGQSQDLETNFDWGSECSYFEMKREAEESPTAYRCPVCGFMMLVDGWALTFDRVLNPTLDDLDGICPYCVFKKLAEIFPKMLPVGE